MLFFDTFFLKKEGIDMNKNLKKGFCFICLFVIWTLMVLMIDVKSVGVNGTNIGLSTLNVAFHQMIGFNERLYIVTDWLGLIPVLICMFFGFVGLIQWIKRKNLFQVDFDILILGIYYFLVIASYVLFEMILINYRPILIDGRMEVSYPSSTTLLVLSVMLSLYEQVNRRIKHLKYRKIMSVFIFCFTLFMILGRIISGVHWISDIIGSLFICFGYYFMYKGIVEKEELWNFMKSFKN